jgi:hypothetical protein
MQLLGRESNTSGEIQQEDMTLDKFRQQCPTF